MNFWFAFYSRKLSILLCMCLAQVVPPVCVCIRNPVQPNDNFLITLLFEHVNHFQVETKSLLLSRFLFVRFHCIRSMFCIHLVELAISHFDHFIRLKLLSIWPVLQCAAQLHMHKLCTPVASDAPFARSSIPNPVGKSTPKSVHWTFGFGSSGWWPKTIHRMQERTMSSTRSHTKNCVNRFDATKWHTPFTVCAHTREAKTLFYCNWKRQLISHL